MTAVKSTEMASHGLVHPYTKSLAFAGKQVRNRLAHFITHALASSTSPRCSSRARLSKPSSISLSGGCRYFSPTARRIAVVSPCLHRRYPCHGSAQRALALHSGVNRPLVGRFYLS